MKRILVGVMAAMLAAAAQNSEAERQLKAAINAELVNGDLKAAIKQYAEIAAKYKNDRAVTAMALVHMAECHQKMGEAESRQIYERVLREYADQKEPAAKARMRLASLGGGVPSHSSIMTRQIWAGPNVADVGPVTADGRYVPYTDWGTGNIALHDLTTGENRDLTHKGTYMDSSEEGEEPVIAPDGKHVAYSWLGKELRYQLRVVGTTENAPSAPRVLYENQEVDWIAPYAWSPDGEWIAVQLQKKDRTAQIGLVNAATGALRVLKSIDWRLANSIFYSPDGRYLLFDLPAGDDTDQRDVFVLATDGSREIPAVMHPAFDVAMGWTPDGKQLLFASNRSGSMGVWALSFQNGRTQGSPVLIKSDIGQAWPLGVSRSGALYFGVRPHGQDLYEAAIDFESGKVISTPSPIVEEFVGANRTPDWSPDGKYLAYQSRRDPTGNGFDILAIRSLNSGEVRELHPKLSWFFGPRWAPDGRRIAVGASDRKGRNGIFTIDPQSGDVSPVVINQPGEYSVLPKWSPDGKKIYFRRGDLTKGQFTLVARDLATGNERLLLRATGEPWPLDISPDGRYLVFGKPDPISRQATLLILPVEGGEPRQVLQLPRPQEFGNFLTWTPDSRSILFRKRLAPTESDAGEVWLAAIDGSSTRQVHLNLANIHDIRIQPGTGKLALTGGIMSGEVWVMENFLSALTAKR
jgi:Tol biopolymer transport system component